MIGNTIARKFLFAIFFLMSQLRGRYVWFLWKQSQPRHQILECLKYTITVPLSDNLFTGIPVMTPAAYHCLCQD